MRISPEVEIALSLAANEAARRRHEYFTLEHLLYALLFDEGTAQVVRHAGGDPQAIGSVLTLDGKTYEILGVAAPVWEARPVDYYMPLAVTGGIAIDRSRHGSIRALGRLKPGVTLAAAREDLDGIMRRLAEVDPGPENEHRSFGQFLTERITGEARQTLIVLMGAALLVLLIACANVASLLLAHGTTR